MSTSVSATSDLTSLYQALFSAQSSSASNKTSTDTSSSNSTSSSTSSATEASDAFEQVKSLQSAGSFQSFLSSSIGAAVLSQSMGSTDTSTLDTLTNLQDHLREQALAAYKTQG